jgi:hypothetical protein
MKKMFVKKIFKKSLNYLVLNQFQLKIWQSFMFTIMNNI